MIGAGKVSMTPPPPPAPGTPQPLTAKDIYDYHQWFGATYQGKLAHRAQTMYQALLVAVGRSAKTFVETGTARMGENWRGDGQSTLVFGDFCKRYGAHLWTCDILETAIVQSRQATKDYREVIEYVVSDSIEFLRHFDRPIDFLYLDSFDFDDKNPDPSQDHAVREAQAALPHLHNGSIILVDDCGLPFGGKGGKVVPWLVGQGYQVIGLNYQILLTLGITQLR